MLPSLSALTGLAQAAWEGCSALACSGRSAAAQCWDKQHADSHAVEELSACSKGFDRAVMLLPARR